MATKKKADAAEEARKGVEEARKLDVEHAAERAKLDTEAGRSPLPGPVEETRGGSCAPTPDEESAQAGVQELEPAGLEPLGRDKAGGEESRDSSKGGK